MTEVIFTAHLRQRMAVRGIIDWQIRAAVNDPISIVETPEGSVCYRGVFDGGRILKVWVVKNGLPGTAIVKSAAWQGEP